MGSKIIKSHKIDFYDFCHVRTSVELWMDFNFSLYFSALSRFTLCAQILCGPPPAGPCFVFKASEPHERPQPMLYPLLSWARHRELFLRLLEN